MLVARTLKLHKENILISGFLYFFFSIYFWQVYRHVWKYWCIYVFLHRARHQVLHNVHIAPISCACLPVCGWTSVHDESVTQASNVYYVHSIVGRLSEWLWADWDGGGVSDGRNSEWMRAANRTCPMSRDTRWFTIFAKQALTLSYLSVLLLFRYHTFDVHHISILSNSANLLCQTWCYFSISSIWLVKKTTKKSMSTLLNLVGWSDGYVIYLYEWITFTWYHSC